MTNRLKLIYKTYYKSRIQVHSTVHRLIVMRVVVLTLIQILKGTENITVTRRHIKRHTNPTPPHKRFRTSTPGTLHKTTRKRTNKGPLKEIINHRPALQIPPVDLTVAPGRQAANMQLGRQRVNVMAGRG